MNFEDFIMMHCESEKLQNWCDDCYKQQDILSSNLTEKDYLPKFKKYFPSYKKGSMPIEINQASLQRCFNHQADQNILLKNEFAQYLKDLYDSQRIEYK